MNRILTTITLGACLVGAASIAMAQRSTPGARKPIPSNVQAPEHSGVYALDTCPVSGEKLGEMGDPVVKTIEGREVRFCCEMCVPKFEADPEKYFKIIDKKIVEQQLPVYPLETCLVTGEPLEVNGEDVGVNFVYENRLVRFCCPKCIKQFKSHPEKYLAMLDKAVLAQQEDHYPLTVCVVSGEPLGHEGLAVERIYAGRLVKFCCKDCIAKFDKDPVKYLKQVDDAWTAEHAKGGT